MAVRVSALRCNSKEQQSVCVCMASVGLPRHGRVHTRMKVECLATHLSSTHSPAQSPYTPARRQQPGQPARRD